MSELVILERRQFDVVISQLSNAKDLDADCLYEI